MSNRLRVRSRFRDYAVTFIDDAFASLRDRDESAFFLVDKLVLDLYGNRLRPILPPARAMAVEATEQLKSMDHCQRLAVALIEAGIRRNSTLIAIGGGIVEDITAFLASILYRGITWVFYPTTLLAQADSCIGSKSSLNVGAYKNLIGTFYPPAEVVIDVNFLGTLSEGDIKSGIGEILHFYLVDGSPRAAELMDRYEEFVHQPVRLLDHIRTSLDIKRRTVEVDELDQNQRNLFNYGHTFGHAIETVTNYSISHGQAVTIGMDIANFLSVRQGYLSNDRFWELHKLLEKNMPSLALGGDYLDTYLAALAKDKKNVNRNLTCILTSGPGSMKKVEIPFDSSLRTSLLEYFDSLSASSVR